MVYLNYRVFNYMKTIYYLTGIVLLCTLSCKSQTIIVPIGSGETIEYNPNYYKKDVNNEFNKFEGAWKYENGTTKITLMLKKEEHYQASINKNFQDLLVGEYKYVVRGNEIINTLLNFRNSNVSGYQHDISGGVFKHILPNHCVDNSHVSEIKVSLLMSSPSDENIEGRLILRYVNNNGVEKLEACIYDNTTIGDNDVRIEIPNGYYVFIKQ